MITKMPHTQSLPHKPSNPPPKHWSERVLESIISKGPNPDISAQPVKPGVVVGGGNKFSCLFSI